MRRSCVAARKSLPPCTRLAEVRPVSIRYKIGTMMETPRATLGADGGAAGAAGADARSRDAGRARESR